MFQKKNVYKWAKLCKEERRNVEDEDRPGRPTEVRSPDNVRPTQQPKWCRLSTTWAENCSLILLTAQTLRLQTFTCLVPWKSSREAQSLKMPMKSKVLWAIGWDISLKIFVLTEYGSLCTDGKIVGNWWEIMLKNKSKIKLLSDLSVLELKNSPCLLNDRRTFFLEFV